MICMEPENENKPPPVETGAAPAEQRRQRPRRRYGRRRYYDRGNRNDNFEPSGQENSTSNHGESGNASTDVETMEGTAPAETENGEQVQTEPEFGEGIIEISGKGFGFL